MPGERMTGGERGSEAMVVSADRDGETLKLSIHSAGRVERWIGVDLETARLISARWDELIKEAEQARAARLAKPAETARKAAEAPATAA